MRLICCLSFARWQRRIGVREEEKTCFTCNPKQVVFIVLKAKHSKQARANVHGATAPLTRFQADNHHVASRRNRGREPSAMSLVSSQSDKKEEYIYSSIAFRRQDFARTVQFRLPTVGRAGARSTGVFSLASSQIGATPSCNAFL